MFKNYSSNKATPNNTTESKKITRKDVELAWKKAIRNHEDVTGIKRRPIKLNVTVKYDISDSNGPLHTLGTGVNVCARRYNECKALIDRLEGEVGKRKDELNELKREALVLEHMSNGRNSVAKDITMLKDNIESTDRSSESILHYRLQLNHLYNRVRRTSTALDSSINEMNDILHGSEQELQKCQKLLADIEIGQCDAVRKFDQTKTEIKRATFSRNHLLIDRKNVMDNLICIEDFRKAQESKNLKLDQSIICSHQLDTELKLDKVRERELELKALRKQLEINNNGQDSSDDAFLHIKMATGVKSLCELVDNFAYHRTHMSILNEEKLQIELRLRSVKESFSSCMTWFQGIKHFGLGDILEVNRDAVIEIYEQISQERTQTKIMKSTNTRLEGVLVGLRQGSIGLYQRLLSFHSTLLEGNAPVLHENTNASAIQAARDTLEMLKIAEQILTKMLDSIGGVDAVSTEQLLFLKKNKVGSEVEDSADLGNNNCRIQTKFEPMNLSDEENDCGRTDLSAEEQDLDNLIFSRMVIKNKR